MEASAASGRQSPPQASSNAPSRGGNRRRIRGGSNRQTQRSEVPLDTPATIETGSRPAGSRGSTHGPGPRRRNQPRPRGSASTTSGHHFSGQLTGVVSEGSQANQSLRADAPAFVPSQVSQSDRTPLSTARQPVPKTQPARRKNSLQRSNAADLGTRIHEDIAHGLYECSICTSEIRRRNKVWSCTTCWSVIHLDCIEQWSKKQRSTANPPRLQDGELPPPFQWRCPGCNLPKDDLPLFYKCWCGKEMDPRGISGVPPHSCGQTCSKPRASPKHCPHPCELTCHAGPCPPCSHMGPIQICFCGKESVSRRCAETDYEAGWSCGALCGELLPCGEHFCNRPCHEGLCGSCEVEVQARCFCGKQTATMKCCETEDRQDSVISLTKDGSEATDNWTGNFDCKDTCGRKFDCGFHVCEKSCHAQNALPSHCLRSPDVVTHCPCGRTLLTQLLKDPRRSCKDSIPCCESACGKVLPCGHLCQNNCHSDDCPPCTNTVSVTCRCGRVETHVICHRRSREPLMCLRVCKAKLNCGRHECGEHCCTGERQAMERMSVKRKLRPLTSLDTIEAEHICTRTCGRLLKCGSHECPELCHKGPCGSCREAIFEEIPCHCGKTVLQPPLPCGTGPPPCRFECERPKACGHPQISHNCHGDSESCPKCPFLVEKMCMCKKKTLKNQPCFLADARCGEICGKKLRCGSHTCRKPCHRPGECEDATTPCQQACGELKKTCGHPCEKACHSPYPCKEDKPCQSKLIITCDCQHLKTETKCLASRNSEGNKNKTLKCDDECARMERNRQLALALNIDPATHQDDHIPYSAETLRLYQEDVNWAQEREKELRIFAADDEERRLRCKPMKPNRRAFLHALAEDFGLDSESTDPEPHRHVFVFKTPRFVKAPMKTLADCMRIRTRTSAALTTSALARTASPAPRPSTPADISFPYNGFVLSNPRFALTVEEVAAAIALIKSPTLNFSVQFMPSEEVVVKARGLGERASPLATEDALKNLMPALTDVILSKKLAASMARCTLDASLNIIRREGQDDQSGGWSQVAARAAGPKAGTRLVQPPALGKKTAFMVLSKTKEKAKPKPEPVEIVDDWEEEMKKEAGGEENNTAEQVGDLPGSTTAVVREDADQPGADAHAVPSLEEANTATNE